MGDIEAELGGNGASEDDYLINALADPLGRRDFLSEAMKLLTHSEDKLLHYKYMARAVELAKESQPDDSGPYVGAVIVKDSKIIAEAYKVREPWTPRHVNSTSRSTLHLCHAEEKAIDIAGDKAQDAVLYVTLEPCIHRNAKHRHRMSDTPCVEIIAQAGIKSVIIGMLDRANPHIAGRGVVALADSGIDVVLYDAGLSEQMLRLIRLGQMRRDSKAKEYFGEKMDDRADRGAYLYQDKIDDANNACSGKKRESNRLKKIIDDGLKEYEEDTSGNN